MIISAKQIRQRMERDEEDRINRIIIDASKNNKGYVHIKNPINPVYLLELKELGYSVYEYELYTTICWLEDSIKPPHPSQPRVCPRLSNFVSQDDFKTKKLKPTLLDPGFSH